MYMYMYTMDIIKAFVDNGVSNDINIMWEGDVPFFRAAEVGRVLEMVNIRATLASNNFDPDEKAVKIIDTNGGPREVTFLTDLPDSRARRTGTPGSRSPPGESEILEPLPSDVLLIPMENTREFLYIKYWTSNMTMAQQLIMLPADAADDRLVAMLNVELTTEEQQLFAHSFNAYLSHDPKRDFVVDMEDVHEWIGFSTKGNAKKGVMKHLDEGVHYRVLLIHKQNVDTGGSGTRNTKHNLLRSKLTTNAPETAGRAEWKGVSG